MIRAAVAMLETVIAMRFACRLSDGYCGSARTGLDMWKRLFPSLAKIEPVKLVAAATTLIYLWVAIAGALEDYFIAQGWITVTYEQVH
jgi:hypothetical protein